MVYSCGYSSCGCIHLDYPTCTYQWTMKISKAILNFWEKSKLILNMALLSMWKVTSTDMEKLRDHTPVMNHYFDSSCLNFGYANSILENLNIVCFWKDYIWRLMKSVEIRSELTSFYSNTWILPYPGVNAGLLDVNIWHGNLCYVFQKAVFMLNFSQKKPRSGINACIGHILL